MIVSSLIADFSTALCHVNTFSAFRLSSSITVSCTCICYEIHHSLGYKCYCRPRFLFKRKTCRCFSKFKYFFFRTINKNNINNFIQTWHKVPWGERNSSFLDHAFFQAEKITKLLNLLSKFKKIYLQNHLANFNQT